jgi:multiple sugar transport system ATP-binding protein
MLTHARERGIMAPITLDKVTKVYPNGFEAVHELELDVADGEFMVLVGPSGCGKTTALRMVAGLEDITDGSLRPPRQRCSAEGP